MDLAIKIFFAVFILVAAMVSVVGFFIRFEILNTAQIVTMNRDVHAGLIINSETAQYATATLGFLIGLYFLLEQKFKRPFLFVFVIPLLALIAGKVLSVLALSLFVLASYAAGEFSLKKFASSQVGIPRFVTALFLGLSINGFLAWIMLHFRVNYFAVYALIYIVQSVALRTQWWPGLLQQAQKLKSAQFSDGQKFILIYGTFLFVYQLVPQYSWDELTHHLYYAKAALLYGKFDFDPKYILALDTSIIPIGAYTGIFMIGGEFAVRFFVFGLFYASFFLFESSARAWLGSRAALYATLTLVLIPFIQFPLSNVYTDCFALLTSLILLFYCHQYWDSPYKLGDAILLNILVVFAALSKQQTVVFLIPLLVCIWANVFYQAWGRKNFSDLKNHVIGAGIGLFILSIPLIHNFVISGNPVYPVFNKFFESPYFGTGLFFERPSSSGFSLLWIATFYGFREELYTFYNKFPIGFVLFCFMVPSICMLYFHQSRKKLAVLTFIFFAGMLLMLKITGPQLRYGISCLGPICLVIGAGTVQLTHDPGKFFSNVILSCFIFLSVLGYISQIPGGSNFNCTTQPYPIFEIFTGDFSESSLNRYRYGPGNRSVFDYASRKYGPDGKGLLLNAPFLYFAGFKAESVEHYHWLTRERVVKGAEGGSEAVSKIIFDDLGFNFLIAPTTDNLWNMPAKGIIEPEFTAGGLSVFRRR